MTFKALALSAHHVWIGIFGVWGLFLSGAMASFVGSPGVIQALRLKNLYDAKQVQIAQLELDIEKVDEESTRLEKNKVAQEREIRRSLGYAASDEVVFDFAPNAPDQHSRAPAAKVLK